MSDIWNEPWLVRLKLDLLAITTRVEKAEAEREKAMTTDQEIDNGSGSFECPTCLKDIEPMEPYLILVVNNTEPPEQQTFRFDREDCLRVFLLNARGHVVLQGEKE